MSELKKAQSEIHQLRKNLNQLSKEKEDAFSELLLAKKEVTSLAENIKQEKQKRDALTNSVKQQKTELLLIRSQKKELDAKLSAITEDKETKNQIPIPILERDLARLEKIIETEAISFDKEQKIMKEVKRKRQILNMVKPKTDQKKQLQKEISILNSKIYLLQHQMQSDAKQSQLHHEKMIEHIKAIEAPKTLSGQHSKKFHENKHAFKQTSSELKEKLLDFSKLSQKANETEKEDLSRKAEADEKELEKIEQELKNKMLSGKKLTTKDLLIFQSQH